MKMCLYNSDPLKSHFYIVNLIVLGFNDTSTLEGHFVSSPREREKRDRRESRGDEREGQGRKRNRNESEETEEIKTFPSTLTHYKDSRSCPTVSQYQLDAPVMKDTQHLCTTRPPPFYIVKLGFTWVYIIFLISAKKNIDCGYSLELPH